MAEQFRVKYFTILLISLMFAFCTGFGHLQNTTTFDTETQGSGPGQVKSLTEPAPSTE